MSKVKFNTYFTISAFLFGLAVVLFNREWFTSYSLVESILVTAAPLYLVAKYTASRIIRRYQQDAGYLPPKSVRFYHEIIVVFSFSVIQPICLDFLYSCTLLLTIKLVSPNQLNILANTINWLWHFNKTHISWPLFWLMGVLGLITLLHILTVKRFKALKKWIGYIKTPIKIAAILILFITIDKGIAAPSISWKMNLEEPEFKPEDQVTFNSGERPPKADKVAEEPVTKMIQIYVNVVVQEMVDQYPRNSSQEKHSSRSAFYTTLGNAVNSSYSDPTVRDDLWAGLAGNQAAYEENEKRTINNFYQHEYSEGVDQHCQAPKTFYADVHAVAGNKGQFSDFMDVLTDEGKSMGSTPLTENEEILKDMLADFIGKTALFKNLQQSVPVVSFFREKAFEVIKDKVAEGFFFLVNKAKKGQLDPIVVEAVALNLHESLRHEFSPVMERIDWANTLFKRFDENYQAAIAYKSRLLDLNSPERVINLQTMTEQFPSDLDNVFNTKLIPVLKAKDDEDALDVIDFDYWKKYCQLDPLSPDIVRFVATLHVLEGNKYILQAKKSQSSADWLYLKTHFAEYANNPAVLKQIKLCRENEYLAAEHAKNDQESYAYFLEQHPDLNPSGSYVDGRNFNATAERASELMAQRMARVSESVIVESPSFFELAVKAISHL